MKTKISDCSPIVYFISNEGHDEWVLFIHAAFVTHEMFKTQFEYFRDKYNILAIDIIGHGLSSKTRKGDSILKMSEWIFGVMQAEGRDTDDAQSHDFSQMVRKGNQENFRIYPKGPG